ncbi:MAG: hypothetical protein IJ728_00710 [Selenomonadaceae bacterium]|nr:hypothetical protein [Selenomonadaceae bacterium]
MATIKQEILTTMQKGIQKAKAFNDVIYATKDELNTAITAAFHYVGSVKTYSSLATVANPKVGDVYNIQQAGGEDSNGTAIKAGDNVARTSTGWDVLAGTTDLTDYVTKIPGKGLSENDFTNTYQSYVNQYHEESLEVIADSDISVAIASIYPGISLE